MILIYHKDEMRADKGTRLDEMEDTMVPRSIQPVYDAAVVIVTDGASCKILKSRGSFGKRGEIFGTKELESRVREGLER
jgi:hypothetical protein